MLTEEQNDQLTQVGPGTPMGELLRRYWYPVAPTRELTEEHPTRFVRMFGEDLVLFRDKSGRTGLLADHCSHRGASLLYGRVEERGISCAYHGWLYDCDGNILETPPERNDAIMNSVKHRAYPVREFIGLYWAYLGPQPAPVIPPYELFVRKDGRRRIVIYPPVDCNWLQIQENAVDPLHSSVLHQDAVGRLPEAPVDTTRGTIDQVATFECYPTAYGVMKRRTSVDGRTAEHPMIFPTTLETNNMQQIKVPIDDTHTMFVVIYFDPTDDGQLVEDHDPVVEYHASFKDPQNAAHPFARHRMAETLDQDLMAWETQGPITNRTAEHLGRSDECIVSFRSMLIENIERVRRGDDPFALVRDPQHPMIVTGLDEGIGRRRVLRSRGSPV